MSYQVCHCGWAKVTTYHGLRTHQGKKGCTPKGMRIPESEQIIFNNPTPKFKYIPQEDTSDMSYQVCHCGWSKVTTYQGLRTHQGKMGCTPKGMRLPESEQVIFNNPTPKFENMGPPITVEEPYLSLIGPAVKADSWRNQRDETQKERRQMTWTDTVMKENAPTALKHDTMTKQEVEHFAQLVLTVMETQKLSPQTTTNKSHRALDFPGCAQTPLKPFPQIIGAQTNPPPTEVPVQQTNKSLFETPQHNNNNTHQTASNAHRALDFFPGAQQTPLKPFPQIFGTQTNPPPTKVLVQQTNKSLFETPQHNNNNNTHQTASNAHRALDFSPGAQQTPLKPFPQIFGAQTNPRPSEVPVQQTNKSLFETPQHNNNNTHQTASNAHRALDFFPGAQQTPLKPFPQIFGTQTNPPPTKVLVQQTNKSLFETPQHNNNNTHQTASNAHRALDFSPGAQQTPLKPFPQIFGAQTNPPPSEVPVQQTNKSLFETPQHNNNNNTHQTASNAHRALDFSPGAQQTPLKPFPQIFGAQTNPPPSEVPVQQTNKSLFETPQHNNNNNTHQTASNAHRALDFSPGAQQTSFTLLKPFPQIFGAQTNPPPTEVPMQQTNKSLFETPQHNNTHQTASNARRALDFSTGAQQLVHDPPTTTAQETTALQKERELERERERQSELEREKEAQKLQQARQDRMKAELQQKIQTREKKIAEVKSSVKACKGSLDADWLEINNVFLEVMRVVEDTRQKALQPLEDRRRRVKSEGQHLVQKLQKEVDKLKMTIDELDKHPDLQVCPPTGLDESKDWRKVTVDTSFSFGSLRTTTANMTEQIQQKLKSLSPVELRRIPTFAVDVKLDPSSAHPCLVLSPDGKSVRDGGKNQNVPSAPQRFDTFGSILGINRLSSGRSYWEVEVTNKTGWDLGVARGDANRKGKLMLNPDNGYWVTVHYEGKKYAALSAPPISLTLKKKPQKVGVFVDYEEGLVSFYDVRARSHIYSFTDCSFGGEVFPYFSPHPRCNESNARPLVISAAEKQK